MDSKTILDYTLDPNGKILGKGAFGTVFLATNKDGQKVALKEIPQEIFNNKESKESIENEIDICSQLKNSNIVKMLDIVHTENNHYVAYELCNGGDLRKYMNFFGSFNEKIIQRIMMQLLNGLEELHDLLIIHHDIKPENILVQLFSEDTKENELKVEKIKKFIDNNKKRNKKIPNKNIPNNHNNQNNNFTNMIPMYPNNYYINNNPYISYLNNNNIYPNNNYINQQFPYLQNIMNNNTPEDSYSSENDIYYEYKNDVLKILKEKADYKLSDFGLSKIAKAIRGKNLSGSPLYMPPELFNSNVELSIIEDNKVDIWSLGVVAFELFFDKRPFEAFSIEQLMDMYQKGEYTINFEGKISKEFFNFLNMCLQKDPAKRATIHQLQSSNFIMTDEESFCMLDKNELLIELKESLEKENKKDDKNDNENAHVTNIDDIILKIDKIYFENDL